jgi:hypothetical protein
MDFHNDSSVKRIGRNLLAARTAEQQTCNSIEEPEMRANPRAEKWSVYFVRMPM